MHKKTNVYLLLLISAVVFTSIKITIMDGNIYGLPLFMLAFLVLTKYLGLLADNYYARLRLAEEIYRKERQREWNGR